MNNFFLLNEALNIADFDAFKLGMSELLAIDKVENDVFMKHQSVYDLPSYVQLHNISGQVEQTIIQFIEQLKSYENYLPNDETFSAHFIATQNAFLGIDFLPTDIKLSHQINSEAAYKIYRNNILYDLSSKNLWSKKDQLFPNLILCGVVERQIKALGNSSHFNQIVERLTVFNRAVGSWEEGDFSYKLINQQYSLKISPETDQTISKYGNERKFKIPGSGSTIFDLHIKTGDLRFHFYPDNIKGKVYVGYIGPHLTTSNN